MSSRTEVLRQTHQEGSNEFTVEPEKQFGAIFSALGNSEAKCLTLLCLSESPMSTTDLYNHFMTESNSVWKANKRTPANYCQETLEPIGLVAEADIIRNGTHESIVGYRLTESGRTFGQPTAAFLLQKSDELDYSLIEIFGPTHSGGKNRSVLNRARILEYLSISGNKSAIEIARSLDLGSNVTGHLQHLASLGIINFEAISAENPGKVKYEINKKAESTHIRKRIDTLSAEILKAVTDKDVITLNEIARLIYPDLPEDEFVILRRKLSKNMTELEKEGACRRIELHGDTRSRASINVQGQQIVSEIIKPIHLVLEENTDLLREWSKIGWRKYASRMIERYSETKPHQNRAKFEGNLETLTLIRENPGIRRTELMTALKRHPSQYLVDLIKEGRVRREKKGRATAYYPV